MNIQLRILAVLAAATLATFGSLVAAGQNSSNGGPKGPAVLPQNANPQDQFAQFAQSAEGRQLVQNLAAQRFTHMVTDTNKLLALARELDSEHERNLSADLKKAHTIEKLAKNLQTWMKAP